MIEAKAAGLVYADHGKEVFACRNLTTTISEGEFVAVLGPSGSGKSSLLYLLSGLKQPSYGEITFHGQDLAKMTDQQRARLRLTEFGFLFQQSFLLGYLTALENIVLNRTERVEEAKDLLNSLGIGELGHRLPHELSGGQRQRVCIARALVSQPKVIFADEPTASLDHATGLQVVELLNKHRQGALVMVTHDESMITEANRVLRIEEGVVI
ncbi:MAG: ATP-binding cassette domain-containing protein [Fimbriimonadaceae bacterium]